MEKDSTTPTADPHQEMDCWIFKGQKRNDTYVYVADQDRLDDLPAGLLQVLGRLELVMTLRLGPQRQLARANVAEVMKDLRDKGYYLQMPPVDPIIAGQTH